MALTILVHITATIILKSECQIDTHGWVINKTCSCMMQIHCIKDVMVRKININKESSLFRFQQFNLFLGHWRGPSEDSKSNISGSVNRFTGGGKLLFGDSFSGNFNPCPIFIYNLKGGSFPAILNRKINVITDFCTQWFSKFAFCYINPCSFSNPELFFNGYGRSMHFLPLMISDTGITSNDDECKNFNTKFPSFKAIFFILIGIISIYYGIWNLKLGPQNWWGGCSLFWDWFLLFSGSTGFLFGVCVIRHPFQLGP